MSGGHIGRAGSLLITLAAIVPVAVPTPVASQEPCSIAEYQEAMDCGVRRGADGRPDLFSMPVDVAVYLSHIRLCYVDSPRVHACMARESRAVPPLLRLFRRLRRLERGDPAEYMRVYTWHMRRGHDEYVRTTPEPRERNPSYGD